MWATQPHYTKDQLQKIPVRTVIFDGDHDEAIKLEHTQEMAELIPNARLEIMPNASHFAMWQQPDAFNASVLNFLDGK
jgi:pimeloyl-ACP methyl ester carboxylesterase